MNFDAFCERFGAKPFFNNQEEYDAFRIDFGRRLKPKLEENRIARAKSEMIARNRFI